jgi:hypothetical protein
MLLLALFPCSVCCVQGSLCAELRTHRHADYRCRTARSRTGLRAQTSQD